MFTMQKGNPLDICKNNVEIVMIFKQDSLSKISRVLMVCGMSMNLLLHIAPSSARDVNRNASTSTPSGGSETPGQSVSQPAAATGGSDLMNTVTGRTASKDRIALTLAGGGARGVAHIGVLRVLEKEGIKPDFIAGTSMGAVVGSLYCAGVPLDEIERLVLSGKMEKGFLPSGLKWQAAKYVPLYLLKRAFQIKPLIGLYSGKSIAKFINKNVPTTSKNIEDLKIPFAAIGTNLLDTRPYWITKGDIGKAVQASATMPFVYRPVETEGRLVVDGGMRTTLRDIAKASGARTIVAVKLQSMLDATSDKPVRTLLGYAERLTTMVLAEIESRAVAGADVIIEPDVKGSTMGSFAREDVLRSIQAGEDAARKLIPQIRTQLAAKKEGTAGLLQDWR
jgi:NTE family protein